MMVVRALLFLAASAAVACDGFSASSLRVDAQHELQHLSEELSLNHLRTKLFGVGVPAKEGGVQKAATSTAFLSRSSDAAKDDGFNNSCKKNIVVFILLQLFVFG